jgi:predicted type IV restriction endonuclease
MIITESRYAHLNAAQKYLGVLKDKEEERIPIDDLDEIFKYADRIKETVRSICKRRKENK